MSGHPTGPDYSGNADKIAALHSENARLRSIVRAVEALANEWEATAGSASKAAAVLGPQKVSVEFAVSNIRAALEVATARKPEATR